MKLTLKGGAHIGSKQACYDEEFKKSLVDLYHNGKTQVSICKGLRCFTNGLDALGKDVLFRY